MPAAGEAVIENGALTLTLQPFALALIEVKK
jgi:hypothetical protein